MYRTIGPLIAFDDVENDERTYVSSTLDESGPINLGKDVNNELLNKRGLYVLHLRRFDLQRIVIGHTALNVAHEHIVSQHSHDGWSESVDWTETEEIQETPPTLVIG